MPDCCRRGKPRRLCHQRLLKRGQRPSCHCGEQPRCSGHRKWPNCRCKRKSKSGPDWWPPTAVTLPHPAYSLDLASWDFALFSKVKDVDLRFSVRNCWWCQNKSGIKYLIIGFFECTNVSVLRESTLKNCSVCLAPLPLTITQPSVLWTLKLSNGK